MSIRTRERGLYKFPALVKTYLDTLHLTLDKCGTSIDRNTLCVSISSRHRAILYSSIDSTPQRTLILETTPFGPSDEALTDPLLTEEPQIEDLNKGTNDPDTLSLEGGNKATAISTSLPYVFLFPSIFHNLMADLPQTAVVITADGFLLGYSDLQKEFRRDKLCLVRSRLCNYLNLYPTEFVTAANVAEAGVLAESPVSSANTKSLRIVILIGTSLGRLLRVTVRIDEQMDLEAAKRVANPVMGSKKKKMVKLSAHGGALGGSSGGNKRNMQPQRSIIKRTKNLLTNMITEIILTGRLGYGYPLKVSGRSISAGPGKNSLLGNSKLGIQAYNCSHTFCTLESIDEPLSTSALGSHKANSSLLTHLQALFSGYTEVDRLSYPVNLKRQVLLQMKETGYVLAKTGGEKELAKLMKPVKQGGAGRSMRVQRTKRPDRPGVATVEGKRWEGKKGVDYDQLCRQNMLNPLELMDHDGLNTFEANNNESSTRFHSLHQSDLDQNMLYKEHERNTFVHFPTIPNDDWITNFLTLDPILHIRIVDLEASEDAVHGRILIVFENRSVLLTKHVSLTNRAMDTTRFLTNIRRYTEAQGKQSAGAAVHATTGETLRKSFFSKSRFRKSQMREEQPEAGEISKDSYDQLRLYGMINRPQNTSVFHVCDVATMKLSERRIFYADKLSTIFPGARYVSCATETISHIRYTDEQFFVTMSDCNVISENSVVFLYSLVSLSESRNLRLMDGCVQKGSVTYALLYYNYRANVIAVDILLNPLLQKHEENVARMRTSDICLQEVPTESRALVMSHIPVSDKLVAKPVVKSKAAQTELLKSLLLSLFDYGTENFPLSDFYARRPTLDIPLYNSRIGYIVTGTQILCLKLLTGVPWLTSATLSDTYGKTGSYGRVYIYNRPIDYFIKYKEELPEHFKNLFSQVAEPTTMQKVLATFTSLQRGRKRDAQELRVEILNKTDIVYYSSFPNVISVNSTYKKNLAFSNRLGLTGKAEDVMWTRGPTASLLRGSINYSTDRTLSQTNYSNMFDSQAQVQLKPHGSEHFNGRNFSFPLHTDTIIAHGFASRHAIHARIRLIRTVHLTSILFLTGTGNLTSLSNYVNATELPAPPPASGNMVIDKGAPLDPSDMSMLFTTRMQMDSRASARLMRSRRTGASDGASFSPYDLLQASYTAYCSGDALFNLSPHMLVSSDLDRLLTYIVDFSIINSNEDPIWCARANASSDKKFMFSGTLSLESAADGRDSVRSREKEALKHKKLCQLYFKSCIQKTENLILFITFLKETGLWSVASLVTGKLKMDMRSYLEGLYGMSSLIRFLYLYTQRGGEDPVLLENDDYSWIHYDYASIIPGYDETMACQRLEHVLGEHYLEICKSNGQFSATFAKFKKLHLNGFEAILSGITLAATEELPLVNGVLRYVQNVLAPYSSRLMLMDKLSNSELSELLLSAQSLDLVCNYLQAALIARESNIDLLSVATYNDIPPWLNSLYTYLYDIFIFVCNIVSQLYHLYDITINDGNDTSPQSFGLLEHKAKHVHERVLVQLVKTIASLADCALQIFYRSKEAGLRIQELKDRRYDISKELVRLPVKVVRAAAVMAKYHDWPNFVRYSFALFELQDLTPPEIACTIMFHPALTQTAEGLSSYFKEYRSGIHKSNVELEFRMLPDEAVPILPHSLLELVSNLIDSGVITTDLEPLSDLRATILDELEAQKYDIRATLLSNEGTTDLGDIIIKLRNPTMGIALNRPKNDAVMEAIYELASQCSLKG